jgi:hypothetical protein
MSFNHQTITTKQKVLWGVLIMSSIFPALGATNFIPGGDSISIWIYSLIASVGGAIFGALYRPDYQNWLIGLIAGTVTNLSVLWLAVLYANFRDSLFAFELVIPVLLGLIPGILVYKGLKRIL